MFIRNECNFCHDFYRFTILQRIPSKFIVAFNDAKLTPSSREVLVHTIRTGSVCGNVMYLFEYTGVLYNAIN